MKTSFAKTGISLEGRLSTLDLITGTHETGVRLLQVWCGAWHFDRTDFMPLVGLDCINYIVMNFCFAMLLVMQVLVGPHDL